jgi:ABC-type Na+ transport system ATPase subunit NatA
MQMTHLRPRPVAADSEIELGGSAIHTVRLSKRYGETVALDSLNLTVDAGEVYGYLGPNGAGKTTTIRLLLGLHHPSAGRGELFGIDAWRDPVKAHARVAYVGGEPFLWPSLTSAETFEFLARLRGATDAAYRDLLIERFQLDTSKKVRALSKGNRQKVQLIAAFATRADLLLLDEPTAGLDPLMEVAFRETVLKPSSAGRRSFSPPTSSARSRCSAIASGSCAGEGSWTRGHWPSCATSARRRSRSPSTDPHPPSMDLRACKSPAQPPTPCT